MNKLFKKTSACIMLFVLFTSCNHEPTAAETAAASKKKMDSINQANKEQHINIIGLKLASKEDPTCGMPVAAGIVDTITIKGKLYGFCAVECKQQFIAKQTTNKSK